MSDDSRAILTEAASWRRQGRGVALATVIATWGSSPRPVGSRLATDTSGRIIGSVSGGCVEAAVIEAGLAAIARNETRVLEFGVADTTAWSLGLACGGRIRIFVETLVDPGAIERLVEPRRHTSALVTRLCDGTQCVIDGETEVDRLAGEERGAVAAAMAAESSRLFDGPHGELFIEIWSPPARLIIVGAVHIAQALAPMATMAGLGVTIVDPRAAFATEDRFPGNALCVDWPDSALADLAPDTRTAIVSLTHDPKIDDPALVAALRSSSFYIGALGSRRTQAVRLERLRAQGFDASALARIHGPVGLAIGAKTPAEIAISILAEIIGARRGAPALKPER